MKPTALDMLNHKTPFNFLHFSLMLALGLAYFPVLAQDMAIVADKQAAGHLQPIILQTANGLPQINIQTPSAAGVSRNQYSQFDVAEKGAILNNGRKASQTQLAGWVQGNPNLAAGEAKIILNEVNSSNPSRLKGYVEVAGQKAEVVIANPSGIHCEGCGVINAGRATLTTGQAEVVNGELKGYQVKGGEVVVRGKGMDNRQADYTDIIANKVSLDAGVWAKSLKVSTGKNKVSRNHDTVVYVGESAVNNSEDFGYAVDVSHLGGMYANRIQLIDHGDGLGVRNAGHIGASAGEVKIDSMGRILNQGQLQAEQSIQLQAQKDIENQTKAKIVSQQGNIDLISQDKQHNQGNIVAKGKINARANALTQSSSGEILGGDVDIQVSHDLTNRGLISSGKENTDSAKTLLKAERISNIGTGRIYGDKVALGAKLIENLDELDGNSVRHDGIVAAFKRLDIGAEQIINKTANYATNQKGASTFYSEQDIYFGKHLNAQDEAQGKATQLINYSGTIEAAKGNIQLNIANIQNLNPHFRAEIETQSDDQINESYVIPKGYDTKDRIDFNLLKWVPFSRAGKLAFKTDNPKVLQPGDSITASVLLPTVNEYRCQDYNNPNSCQIKPESIYDENNSAWAYFGITPPSAAPADLPQIDFPDEPIKPIEPILQPKRRFESAEKYQQRFEAYQKAKAKYDQEIKQYEIEKQSYPQRLADYEKAMAPFKTWLTENENAFNELSKKINAHNAKIAGRRFSDFWITKLNRRVHDMSVVKATLPGQILAGGDIDINTDELFNNRSQVIAGANLNIQGNLRNEDETGFDITNEYGTNQYTWSRWRGGFRRYHQRDWGSVNYYNNNITTPFDMGIAVKQSHTDYKTNLATQPTEAGKLDNQEDMSTIWLPSSSLYKLNPNSANNVLVETDPAFANRKKWLSSEYMFNQLRIAPENVHKRLGDGYYEQRLVREQINQLTGKMFTDNQHDIESQYKTLMDNGISFANAFHLRPGIKLSAAQVASLTADIVWFETETVKLPDGREQQVLVPKVYLVAQSGDVDKRGALLSAQRIGVSANQIINQGVIAGREISLLQQDKLQSLLNQGNILGERIKLQAKGDITNLGGKMIAEQEMNIESAGKITHQSTLAENQVSGKGYQREASLLSRKALLYVKGEGNGLTLAANDIEIKGADIVNEGKGYTQLQAKNSLKLTALETSFNEKMGGGDHYRQSKSQDVIISHIKGKGDVTIKGKDILSEGGQLESEKKLTALAENSLVLKGAQTAHHFEEYHHSKTGSLAKKSKTSFESRESRSQVGSMLSGEEIALLSGNQLTAQGANIVANKDIAMSAKGDIKINALTNEYKQLQWEKQKKSGFMLEKSAGSMRIGFGVSRAKDKDSHQSTQVVSSQLQSLSGNINVVSQEGNVSGNAVILDAGKDIYLQGKNIALKAATETQIKEHQSTLKSASMGIGITYKPKATFKQAYGEQEGQGSAGSAVGKGITAGEALDKTSHKVTQQFAPYVSAKASQSTHQEQHNNAVVSQLNAGGKLSLIATEGNLSTEGALLSAKEDGTLWAKQDIDLGVALSTQSQNAKGTRIGFDFDASRRPTDVVGKYLGKEQGEGESEKQHTSVLSFGGKGSITAKEGNLTLLGSQVVANDNVSLSAGKNIRLATSVDSIAQGDSNTFHGMGEAVVSETERFSGYNRKLGNQEGKQTTHTGASIASLKNNVDIYAGKDLHQTSAQVLAKNRINISAENVVADTAYNSTSHNSHQSDLKVGMFARVISPIIDLVNSVEKSVKDKEASDRVKAAQLMGLAAQGYNLNHALNHDDKAVLFRAEIGVGLAHSRQRQTGENQESIGNQLNAKEINVEARNGNLMTMQTDFTARDEKGERIAESHINLSAKENIELYAGKSHYRQQGKNQSYGTEVGTAFSVGAKTGWSFYAKEGFSKGKQESEGKTYHNSHIDTDTLTLSSGKDTALIGATAKAKTIYADIKGNLHIESQQDEHKQNSKQFGLGTKVEFGFGSSWEFSGNASAEGGKSNSKQVNEQAGLFAEEGGYHISADNVHLKGGVIASTNAKNSELTTNKLTFEDIQNSASHSATSASISGGYGKEADYHVDNETGEKVSETYAKNNPNSTTKIVPKAGPKFNPALPMHEQGEDSTTTKATLTEGKITLNKDSQPTETTATALGINTDISQANKQVEQPKDVNQLLKEQKPQILTLRK